MFGVGKQTDQLVETMNHPAENAVAEAKPILSDSIKTMSVQDAKGILTSGGYSVAQYFKRTSTEQLTAKFMPFVKAATRKLQLAEQYNAFAGKAARAGLSGRCQGCRHRQLCDAKGDGRPVPDDCLRGKETAQQPGCRRHRTAEEGFRRPLTQAGGPLAVDSFKETVR